MKYSFTKDMKIKEETESEAQFQYWELRWDLDIVQIVIMESKLVNKSVHGTEQMLLIDRAYIMYPCHCESLYNSIGFISILMKV